MRSTKAVDKREDQSSVEMSLVPSVCHQWKMEQMLAVEVLPWILEALALLSELHQQHQPSMPSLEEGVGTIP